MKKTLLVALLLAIASQAMAIQSISESIYKSSFTATNDATVQISGSRPGSQLFGVSVGSTTAGGVLTLFDGQGANASTKIGTVSLGTIQNPQYFVTVSSGITYTTTGNTSGVTIMYLNPIVP